MYGRYQTAISRPARVLLFPQCRTMSKMRKIPSKPAKLADMMVDVLGNRPDGWKGGNQAHSSLFADARRKQMSRPPSMDRLAFSAPGGATEVGEDGTDQSIEPGTFVELRKNGVSASAVVLAEAISMGTEKMLSLTSSGEIWDHRPEDALFSIPAFAPLDMVERCGIDIDAENQVQLHGRVEVLRRIREMDRSVARAVSSLHAWDRDIYSTFKSASRDKWSSLAIPELARMWVPRPSAIHYFACHKFLMERPLFFLAPYDYNVTQTFEVRPESDVELIRTVTKWCSSDQASPVTSFVLKARKVVAANEKQLKESLLRLEEPSWVAASYEWSDDDRTILKFLVNALRPVRPSQQDPYEVAHVKIIRAIFPEAPVIDDSISHKLLISLGVMAPWHDLLRSRADLRHYSPEVTKAHEAIAMKSFHLMSHAPPPKLQPLGPFDLHRGDPLESVRRDFGNLPVYVIDDPTAMELDDGISIESIPTEPDHFWVHVHIADPCSLIPPTHVLAQEAAKRSETLYLLDRVAPLLPTAFTTGKTGASLRLSNQPQRVMTFSSKVDADGGLYESVVSAGFVRNVLTTTYDSVNAALGKPPPPKHYPFGQASSRSPTILPLSRESVEDLRHLEKIASGFVRKRLREGAFTVSREFGTIKKMSVPAEPTSPSLVPGHFRGYPDADYCVETGSSADSGAMSLVGEAMKLACWSASRWCLERGIPVIRRGASPPILLDDGAWQDLLSLRTSNGYVPQHQVLPYVMSQSTATYSIDPVSHFGLSIPEGEGYTRVTSPLRRYGDMVTHWQIQAALLGNKPPFSKDWLSGHARTMKARDKVRSRAVGQYDTFFTMSLFQRWLEDSSRREGKLDPFQSLQGHIFRSPTLGNVVRSFQGAVTVAGLGVRALLTVPRDMDLPPGAPVQLKLQKIQTGLVPYLAVTLRD